MIDHANPRELIDLGYLQDTLHDEGFVTELYPKSLESPSNMLMVAFPPSSAIVNHHSRLQLLFLQTADLVQQSSLLQFFAWVETELPTDHPEVEHFIHFLNQRTALGAFNIGADQHLQYRYVYAFPRTDVPQAAPFMEIFRVVIHQFENYGALVLKLAESRISLAEAKSTVTY